MNSNDEKPLSDQQQKNFIQDTEMLKEMKGYYNVSNNLLIRFMQHMNQNSRFSDQQQEN